MNVKDITQKIVKLREEKNYSQTYLADKLGMSQKAYSKIETGETKLTVFHLMKIAEVLEVNLTELFDASNVNIYNNYHTHNGEGIVINKTASEEIKELYEKLLQAKDREIELLKKLKSR